MSSQPAPEPGPGPVDGGRPVEVSLGDPETVYSALLLLRDQADLELSEVCALAVMRLLTSAEPL